MEFLVVESDENFKPVVYYISRINYVGLSCLDIYYSKISFLILILFFGRRVSRWK